MGMLSQLKKDFEDAQQVLDPAFTAYADKCEELDANITRQYVLRSVTDPEAYQYLRVKLVFDRPVFVDALPPGVIELPND